MQSGLILKTIMNLANEIMACRVEWRDRVFSLLKTFTLCLLNVQFQNKTSPCQFSCETSSILQLISWIFGVSLWRATGCGHFVSNESLISSTAFACKRCSFPINSFSSPLLLPIAESYGALTSCTRQEHIFNSICSPEGKPVEWVGFGWWWCGGGAALGPQRFNGIRLIAERLYAQRRNIIGDCCWSVYLHVTFAAWLAGLVIKLIL